MGAPEAFTATTEVGHFINGRAVASTSGRRQPVWNPSTGAFARQVALGSVDGVGAFPPSLCKVGAASEQTPVVVPDVLPRKLNQQTPRRMA